MSAPFSRLGLGLAEVTGSYTCQEKLVRTAVDCNIRHFDVSPFYTNGDTEKNLGKILFNCKEDVTVATKVGPALCKPAGFKVFHSLFGTIAKTKQNGRRLQNIKKGQILMSFEGSLQRLKRTPEVLLLNGYEAQLADNQEVVDELDFAREKGNVKLTGISGSSASVLAMAKIRRQTYCVAQTENNLAVQAPVKSLYNEGARVITRVTINGAELRLRNALQNTDIRELWKKETGWDVLDAEMLLQLLIELSLAENPFGMVLFCTNNISTIKRVAALLEKPSMSVDSCNNIRDFVRSLQQAKI